MSSSSDEFIISTPPEVSEAAKNATLSLLPEKSNDRYLQAYQNFITWKTSKYANSFSENAFLAYFMELSQKYKSSSLWCYYSMLKSTVRTKHGIDIKSYSNLQAFLKRRSEGHVSRKSKVFSADNVKNFLKEAPDCKYLATKPWLSDINWKNKWHHDECPLIWKELLMKGSKPYYIGGASEFWEYCHSYYKFEAFFSSVKLEILNKNITQFKRKVQSEIRAITCQKEVILEPPKKKKDFVISITGVGINLATDLIAGLLEMSVGDKKITKMYIYDDNCSLDSIKQIEHDCSFVSTDNSTKVVKCIEQLGKGLVETDLLIILDHTPFEMDYPIGFWLGENRRMMEKLSYQINGSAPSNMKILLPNLGPACYNATILSNILIGISKNNIVVATSDLGLEIIPVVAEIAEVPMRNIFCPPVWGFVGINNLVDVKTTVHRYDTFDPYNRYLKVKNSTLTVGSIKPEMRTMEYLMLYDETLWIKVAEKRKTIQDNENPINKIKAIIDIIKLWLFEPNSDNITSLGIHCNGSFGLNFEGVFSQPAHLLNGIWQPAADYFLPKDPQMKLPYLLFIADMMMSMATEYDLPEVKQYYPCICRKPRLFWTLLNSENKNYDEETNVKNKNKVTVVDPAAE